MLDLDGIRAQIEGTFQGLFDPSVFDPSLEYEVGERVAFDGVVWKAVAPVTGETPELGSWASEGPSMPVLYENVDSKIPEQGAIRIVASWGATQQVTVPSGRSGYWNLCNGTLTCWVYTPVNVGTSKALQVAARIRDAFRIWSNGAIGVCGSQLTVTNPDGPRSIQPSIGSTFYGHVLSCSLKAIETVPIW